MLIKFIETPELFYRKLKTALFLYANQIDKAFIQQPATWVDI